MIRDLSPRLQRALYYSPLSFLRGSEVALSNQVLTAIAKAEEKGAVRRIGSIARLYVRFLEWDSQYFSCPTYRIEFADWDEDLPTPHQELVALVQTLKTELAARHPRYYLFGEIPSEDIVLVQALGESGVRLIETRLTYFRDDLDTFAWPKRFAVRAATEKDIPNLREVAVQARNRYDRFHADPFFSSKSADDFLATFVENSVKGYADIVLVPDDHSERPDAFLTGSLVPGFSALLKRRIGQMVLSAVGKSRRGWYLRLIAEMSYWFQQQQVPIVYLTTQSANREVIRVWEKLDYCFGRTTHILSTHG